MSAPPLSSITGDARLTTFQTASTRELTVPASDQFFDRKATVPCAFLTSRG